MWDLFQTVAGWYEQSAGWVLDRPDQYSLLFPTVWYIVSHWLLLFKFVVFFVKSVRGLNHFYSNRNDSESIGMYGLQPNFVDENLYEI